MDVSETVDIKVGWKTPLFVFFLVFFAWGLNWYLLKGLTDQEKSAYGDMFGPVSALFSGLAFAGVIYAMLLQKKELSLQRSELELTRQELAGQRKQLETQSETFRKQNFEETFFKMLSLHNDIVNSIDLFNHSSGKVTRGRDCFVIFYERLGQKWNFLEREYSGKEEIGKINYMYMSFFKDHQAEVGHYFRYLYNIIKFVDRSQIDDKKFYTNLVRAQLSSAELLLLFYNCLSQKGNKKFKPFVEKYLLLKTLPTEKLLDKSHVSFYESGTIET